MLLEIVSINSATGLPRGPMPDVFGLEISPILNDVGVVKFSYPNNGINRAWISEEQEFAVYMDGVELQELRCIAKEIGDNQVSEDSDGYPIEVICNTMPIVLKDAIVYPQGWPTTADPPEQQFATKTAGAIMKTLLQQAQTRGSLSAVTHASFVSATDSNSVAWPTSISLAYAAGVNYLDVVKQLVDSGLCDFKMVARDLRLYLAGTLSVDRTTGSSPVILFKGKNLTEAPSKKTSADLGNVILVAGADNKYVEVTDAPSITTWGRRERLDSQGNCADTGTLTSIGQQTLSVVKQIRQEQTAGLVFDGVSPIPFVDFNVGDWVWYDNADGTPWTKLRVKQIVLSQQDDGSFTGSATMGDLIDDLEESVVKKIKGILGGTDVSGGSKVEPARKDTLAPKTPTGLAINSSTYTAPDGTIMAQITITWNAVTQNSDNSACDDLQAYDVDWNYGSSGSVSLGYHDQIAAGTTTLYFSPVRPGQQMSARVRARDNSGNSSAWSSTVTATTVSDTTPPATPSTPTGEAYLGTVTVRWNGLDNVGAVMASDFSHIEIHRSTVSGFTPSGTTLVGSMDRRGYVSFTDVDYDVPVYFKFKSVDKAGNVQSVASNELSLTPTRLVSADIGDIDLTYKDFAYKDQDNLVPDGSFESAAARAARPLTYFTYSNAAANRYNGDWFLRLAHAAGMDNIYEPISDPIDVIPGEVYWGRMALRGTSSPAANGDIVLSARITFNDNTTSDYNFCSPVDSSNVYNLYSGSITIPANAKSMVLQLWTWGTTTVGAVSYVDTVEVRRVIGTALIQDAAITTAKIADAQITNAKIGNAEISSAKINDVTANKITTGTLTAVVTISGTIRTAASGARVVIDSNGIEAFNSAGTKTVDINSSDGSASITGTFQTGMTGARVALESAAAQIIKFYSGSASEYVEGSISSTVSGSGSFAYSYLDITPPRLKSSTSGHPNLRLSGRLAGSEALGDITLTGGGFFYVQMTGGIEGTGGPFYWNGDGTTPFQINWTSGGDAGLELLRAGAAFLDLKRNSVISGDNSAVIQSQDRGLVIGTWNGTNHSTYTVRSFTIRDYAAAAGTAVHVDGNGVLRKTSSSLRYKQQIEDLVDNGDWIDVIRPVSFKENGAVEELGDDAPLRYGFIAEEVADINSLEPVVVRWGDQVETVQYDRMVPLLVLEIRRLRARLDELESAGV